MDICKVASSTLFGHSDFSIFPSFLRLFSIFGNNADFHLCISNLLLVVQRRHTHQNDRENAFCMLQQEYYKVFAHIGTSRSFHEGAKIPKYGIYIDHVHLGV